MLCFRQLPNLRACGQKTNPQLTTAPSARRAAKALAVPPSTRGLVSGHVAQLSACLQFVCLCAYMYKQHMRTCMYVIPFVRSSVRPYVWMRMCTYACIAYLGMYACGCMRVCTYVRMCVCMYLWMHSSLPLSLYLCLSNSICLSIYLSIYLFSLPLPLSLSLCLSLSLSLSLCVSICTYLPTYLLPADLPS